MEKPSSFTCISNICFGTLSVFGMEKRGLNERRGYSRFGTLSVFGMEKHRQARIREFISFGTLLGFGKEEPAKAGRGLCCGVG